MRRKARCAGGETENAAAGLSRLRGDGGESEILLSQAADGFIVGSEFKRAGIGRSAVEAKRVENFMAAHAKLADAMS
jgi:predicted TIM-barrel enzyme